MPPQTNGAPPAIKNVGYIGLGNAGFSMASNLPKSGYHLVVHDADTAKAEKAAKDWPNTTVAYGKPEAFKDCEVVITMLPQGKVVREVLLGEANIASGLKPGTIVVDTSSSSPFDTEALGKELAAHQIQLVDSPITQTYMYATDAGESTLMVGCDSKEAYDKVEPILRSMASYVFHMGGLGKGHAMKTLNNYTMAGSVIALLDSLVAGQKFGLDPQQMIDVLNVGTGACFPTLDSFRRSGITRRWDTGFGLALLIKDIGITEEFMQHNGFETEFPALTRRYLSEALKQVEPNADHTKALVGWEKRAGVQLKQTETVKDLPKEDFEHRLKGLNRSR